jgi:hypothetical protein
MHNLGKMIAEVLIELVEPTIIFCLTPQYLSTRCWYVIKCLFFAISDYQQNFKISTCTYYELKLTFKNMNMGSNYDKCLWNQGENILKTGRHQHAAKINICYDHPNTVMDGESQIQVIILPLWTVLRIDP